MYSGIGQPKLSYNRLYLGVEESTPPAHHVRDAHQVSSTTFAKLYVGYASDFSRTWSSNRSLRQVIVPYT